MKHTFLVLLFVFTVACKVDSSKTTITSTSENTVQLSETQISISSANISSYEVEQFAEEIQRRQTENPNQIFEVVPRQNSNTSSAVLLSALKDNHLYKNKNFYIFIGLGPSEKDGKIQKMDWDAIYSIMNYVAKNNFRVMINVQATAEHLKLAAEDSETSIILWSSHGNKKAFFDYNEQPVPYDVFKKKSKSFYQFILSSCEGRIALNDNYTYDSSLKTWSWEGVTNSADLRKFLVSDAWDAFEGKPETK